MTTIETLKRIVDLNEQLLNNAIEMEAQAKSEQSRVLARRNQEIHSNALEAAKNTLKEIEELHAKYGI